MPYTKILIHAIWSTKNRQKLISSDLKEPLLNHIKSYCQSKKIHLDFINCVEDHVHLLLSVDPDIAISKVLMLVKGESSHWINRTFKIPGKFAWQSEYIAVSVSQSIVDKVRKYIKNQGEHHRHKTFTEEYNLFLKKYGFVKRD